MKICFTAKGTEWNDEVEARFGRTDYLVIYDEESKELTSFDNSEIKSQEHGAGPTLAQKVFDMKVNVLITGNGPGGNALTILNTFELKTYIGAAGKTLREAYDSFKKGELKILGS